MKSILLAALILSVFSFKSLWFDTILDSGDALTDDQILDIYQDWLLYYKKNLNDLPETFGAKYQTFKQKVRDILEHNSDKSQTYIKGLNEYSDMTDEEFNRFYLMDP